MSLSTDSLITIIFTLSGFGISGIVWLVRLEGRINTESQLRESQIQNTMSILSTTTDRQSTFETRIYQELREIKEMIREKADR